MAAPGPSYMTKEQVGQQPSSSPVSHAYTYTPKKPSPLKSLVQSTFMSSTSQSTSGTSISGSHKAWTAEYLTDLRTNRVPRPVGSRPLPPPAGSNRNAAPTPPPGFIPSMRVPSTIPKASGISNDNQWISQAGSVRCSSVNSHRRAQSMASIMSTNSSMVGRPLAQPPCPSVASPDDFSPVSPSIVRPSSVYVERGERWMERQEARSLREALEDMDLMEEEARLHAAAQDEAAELVWQHRNPGVPYRNPDVLYNYKQHLEKGSHARSHSIGRYAGLGLVNGSQEFPSGGSASGNSGSNSGQSSRVSSGSSGTFSRPPMGNKAQSEQPVEPERGRRTHALWDSPGKKAYMNLTFPTPFTNRRRSSGSRSRVASGDNGTSLFRNPDDQIYEEPEEETSAAGNDNGSKDQSAMPAPLRLKPRNPFSKVQFAKDPVARSNTAPPVPSQKLSRYDIHKNPPSQSRDPGYVINGLPPTPPDSAGASDTENGVIGQAVLMRDGVEIRGDDIRQATSMKLKDRSPKLPTPTVVSDRPGRPIVSFESNWKPKEVELKQELSSSNTSTINVTNAHGSGATKAAKNNSNVPMIHINDSPSIPTINVMDVPSISIAPPTINEPSSKSAPLPSSKRPLPKPKSNPFARSTGHHSASAPLSMSGSHYSLSSRRPTASCTQCQLPISGRIVSAAGQRFHPQCFICYHCGEGLECVAFYPEPENKRNERLDRIAKRAQGIDLPDVEGQGVAEDGDNALRFYCHLDFHELFSPRCRSCKTPIEGEIIVACGGEWHAGHFFCAECGDPFDSKTPFVEKDGYAWCINCHTRRYSTKCKKCRRPVTDMVVKALGAEWHNECFCCVECGSQFQDGRYFLRNGTSGEEPVSVCVKCEEMRLKA